MVHPGPSWAILVHPGPATSQSRWEQHSRQTLRLRRVPAKGQHDSRKAFGDCTRHLGMFRGGTKGQEWKAVHENSVPHTLFCVKGSEQQEQGSGSQELLFLCQKLGSPMIQGQLLGQCLSTAAARISTGYMQVCKFSTVAVSCRSDSSGTWEQGAAAAPPVLGHWTGKPLTNPTSFLHANSFSCWSLLFLPIQDAGTLYCSSKLP